jgi:hypothetical protein
MTWMWLAVWFPLAIGSFALIEGYAIRYPDRQWTLSRTMAWLGSRYPLTAALIGGLFVGLLIHFYAPFCPFGGSAG